MAEASPIFKPGDQVLLGETLAKGGAEMLEYLALANLASIPYIGVALTTWPVLSQIARAVVKWWFGGFEKTAGRYGVKLQLKFEDPLQQAKADAAKEKIQALQNKPDATKEEVDEALNDFDEAYAALGRRRRL